GGPKAAVTTSPGRFDTPDIRVPFRVGVELDQLAELGGPVRLALVLHRDVEHALGVDDDGGVHIVAYPVVEHDGSLALSNAGDVEPHDPSSRVGEVDPLLEDDRRALDRDVASYATDQLVGIARYRNQQLGIDRHQTVLTARAVQLDGEEPGVLTPDVEHVVDDDRIPVPVVVPDPVDHVGVERPQLCGPIPVQGDDPEAIVSRAGVQQR